MRGRGRRRRREQRDGVRGTDYEDVPEVQGGDRQTQDGGGWLADERKQDVETS